MAQTPREKLEDEDTPMEGGQEGAFAQLRGVASEAAVAVLTPVAKKLATNAAKIAVQRGPELIEDLVPKLQDSFSERFGGSDDEDEKGGAAGDGTGKGRRMPVQQSVDVAVPIDEAYDQWTRFEEWPEFMHRVDSVQQVDDSTVHISTKVWGVTKEFEAEIVEQRPDERIEWHSEDGLMNSGVVTFHRLAPRLTRIEVTMDVKPDSLLEKAGRGMRFTKRAVRGDLHRFKAYVEMEEHTDKGWRGTIEDGDVKRKTESKTKKAKAKAKR